MTGRLSYCQTGVGVHWGVGTDPPGVDFRVIIEGVGQITGGLNPPNPPRQLSHWVWEISRRVFTAQKIVICSLQICVIMTVVFGDV